MKGKVKWYSVEKGFGFITSKDCPNDIFVHASDILEDVLIDGQNVEFEFISGFKPKAKKVKIVPQQDV